MRVVGCDGLGGGQVGMEGMNTRDGDEGGFVEGRDSLVGLTWVLTGYYLVDRGYKWWTRVI